MLEKLINITDIQLIKFDEEFNFFETPLRPNNILISKQTDDYNSIIKIESIFEKLNSVNKKEIYLKASKYSLLDDLINNKPNDISDYIISDFKYFYSNRTKFENIEELKIWYEKSKNLNYKISDYNLDKAQENSTSLVSTTSSQVLHSLKNSIDKKSSDLAKLEASMKLVLNEQQLILKNFIYEMDNKMSLLKEESKRIGMMIWTIELYLGIKETIVQINSGETSKIDTKISLIQEVYYMDEEVGNPWENSIDYSNIEDFDKWLCLKGGNDNLYNFERLMPEKSVCIFKVRRNDKQYSENPFINSIQNLENHKSYILIRNGFNVYRIWSDIQINKLFPNSDELIKLQEENFGLLEKYKKDTILTTEQEKKLENDEAKAEGKVKNFVQIYQRQFIVLQGIIDRTTCFEPMPKFSFLKPEDVNKNIDFVYNSTKISDGKLLFKDWILKINSFINVGNRIIFPDVKKMSTNTICQYFNGGFDRDRYNDRYSFGRNSGYNLPDSPSAGIYYVNEMIKNKKGEENEFTILYMPTNKQRTQNKRESFKFDKRYDLIINYDLCTLEDVEYYLYNRNTRKDYLAFFPLLMELQKHLIKDRQERENFILMLKADILKETGKEYSDYTFFKAIDWWMMKNIWKRSISTDDAKAYRMIKSFIINEKIKPEKF